MKKLLLIFIPIAIGTAFLILNPIAIGSAFAQYPIGNVYFTFNDPARSRDVTCWVRYPAVSAGTNVDPASGSFPVIVFGHGFVMDQNAYSNIWNVLVPKGYIVVLPTTEGTASPSHTNFGGDIAFLAAKMLSEGANSSSPFYNHIAPKNAVMGHSMGGGSSFLAAENNTGITTMVTLAAAETNPSSITAAANISIPALTIAGQDDCIAPPATNALQMHTALASTCKTYININNGSHCFFAENNFNCNFGEGTCNPVPDIARADQQDATADMFTLWFDYWLKDNCQAWEDLQDSLAVSQRITSQQTCTQLTPSISMNGMYLEANPAGNYYQWYYEGNLIPGANGQQHQPDLSGNYAVEVTYTTCPVMSAPYPYNVTGIQNIQSGDIRVYPNPVGDFLFFSGTKGEGRVTGELKIYDTNGKIVLTSTLVPRTPSSVPYLSTINISSLSPGLYFINFTPENGINQSLKFVKK